MDEKKDDKKEKDFKEGIDKQNADLRKNLEDSEKYWNDSIESLSKRLIKPVNETIQLQAEAISLRQILTEEIKNMSYQIFKFKQKMKGYEKDRLEWYILQFPAKATSGEKAKMIEGELAAYQYRLDIFDVHINFLRETQKDIDNINFAVKNKITLFQLTEME
jgi:hypothetical protein